MNHPELRLNDGFDHTSPDLREDVRELQRELKKEGFKIGDDGLFGRDTEIAVKQFQSEHGLDDDGVVGAYTWAALLAEPAPKPGIIFSTTYATSNPSLLQQLAEANKYKALIEEAAKQYNFPVSLIAGIGSRESRWGLALQPAGPGGTGDAAARRFPTRFRDKALPPDGGFGRGLMQIDFDAHEFARTGNWKDARENILYGAKVLGDNRDFFTRREPTLTGMKLLQVAVASYNTGAGNVLSAIRDQRDIDYYTAGRNYSKDALDRAGWFQTQGWA
jgi:hypothetical protein